MLEEFCGQLSDKAQLKLALRLINTALPLWNEHFLLYSEAENNLNQLITPQTKVPGAESYIKADFVENTLWILEKNLEQASSQKFPVFQMKQEPSLLSLWATATQVLLHSDWNITLPTIPKLVFTALWNVLAWICLRQKNNCNQTHVFVAISQAADALISGNILLPENIESLCSEYNSQPRSPEEDEAWIGEGQGCESDFEIHEIYQKIIGKSPVKDPPSQEAITHILEEMKNEGKSYWDQWEEYYNGICIIYSYNLEKKSFWCTESDAITGNFNKEHPMSRKQMADFLARISISEFRVSGFEI
ncbi:MAG: hypothetical protein JXR70_03720 [Spirochaetales bacterium]|nr:hypothetical protein [Spirochaetales bacterium]